MRKKLTRPHIEEIVRAKLKDKLSEQSIPIPEPPPPPPAELGPPLEKSPVQGSPAVKSLYGGQEGGGIYDYFNVQPPAAPPPGDPPPADAPPAEGGYVPEQGQPMTPPPGNRDIPVMPPLREGEGIDEGVGMYLMNKAGAISDRDYKNYKREQQMKRQGKLNLGTSADDIKQGTGRVRQMQQIDSGGVTENQLREFVRSKLTQILKAPNQKKVSESIFAPNHYCVHHGGVYLNGKVYMAEAVRHNYNEKLGKVTHYDMRLSNGRILENVPAEAIQITNASLAEDHPAHRADAKDKDDDTKSIEDGSFEIDEGSGDRNDKDREQGHGKQRQKAGSDGKKGELEEVSDKEWYDGQLFEALSRKWTK